MTPFEVLFLVLFVALIVLILVVLDGRLVTKWRKRFLFSTTQRGSANDSGVGILVAGEYKVLDGDGNAKYFKTQNGTGVTGDPWIPQGAATLLANSGVDIGDVDVTSVAGNVTVVQATAANLKVDASGVAVPVTDNAGSLTVDNGGTFAVQESGGALTSLQLIDDTVATDGAATPTKGLLIAGQDGTNAQTIKTDVSGELQIDVLSIAAGDNNIGNVDIVTLPNVTLAAGTNTNEVVGDVAHSAAAAGNPVLLAGISQDMDDTAPPNQVDVEADATRIATDRDGAVFVRPFGPRIWSYHEDSSSALTDASVHAAPASGLSLYVTDIVVSTGAATAFNVFFEEGVSKVLGPYYLEAVAGRGLAIHFLTPKKITAATALTVTTSAAIAHSIDIQGFIAQG